MATVGRLLTRSPSSGEGSASAVGATPTGAPEARPARDLGEVRRPAIRAALLDAVPAWVAARVVVGTALVLAHLSVSTARPHDAAAAQRVHEGLLSWDAGWYQAIAAHGYATAGTESLRFFPAFPMAARALSWLPGVTAGAALVVLSNLAALAAMVALGVLVRVDLGDADLARRAVWLMALAPAAYTFVLGYADSSLLLLAVLTVLAARRRWWWAAALAGLGAGLVRPLGVLLAVPVAVEALRFQHGEPHGERSLDEGRAARAARLSPRAAAVVAPLAGAAGYLAWVGAQ
ncbi:MAG TPA: mannosyltransferase family protein, partial [Acidimicrobiales bacterium]|nr:mannosyltransferase family protein [Acidimicrobiales bacterium]